MPNERKEKIAIFGDVHSNLEAFTAALERMQELEVTHYVCIGDIVGYNANPHECLEMLQSLNPLSVIKGNHDEYIGTNQDLLGFNPQAEYAVQWTRTQLTDEERQWLKKLKYTDEVRRPGTGMRPFKTVHGTLDNPNMWGYIFNRLNAMASMEYQLTNPLCFYGHTHIPMYFTMENESDIVQYAYEEGTPVEIKPNVKYLFNVGSIGQPRDGDSRGAFVVYTPSDNLVQLHKFEYDIELCQKKILECGLPERLAQRLEHGK